MHHGNLTQKPLLIAIVGGSGAGKSWLADQLQVVLGDGVGRLSLDDFYRDRSHLSPRRRQKINFDHPRAIDWPRLEQTLNDLVQQRPVLLRRYDFKTHACRAETEVLEPRPLLLVDGLWLLRRASTRRLFVLRIFIDCPADLRFDRRLARDQAGRGRTRAFVRWQFHSTVLPMHDRFVAGQKRWADIVMPGQMQYGDVKSLAKLLQDVLSERAQPEPTAHSKPPTAHIERRRTSRPSLFDVRCSMSDVFRESSPRKALTAPQK